MDWLNEHAEDPDLNEALLIVGQSGEGELKKEYQGQLSKEERIRNAEAKIKAGRVKRAEDDKKNNHEREMNRILNTKEA